MTTATTKVFGVGLSKTGTTSLNAALRTLGYNAVHNPECILHATGGNLSLDLAEAAKFDAITDLPAAFFFKLLDQNFPGSKFILTRRDEDAWLSSCEDHFYKAHGNEISQRLQREVYGTVVFDRERFRQAMQRHDQNVVEYFSRRADQLMILDISEPDKMTRLCGFLGLPAPTNEFPHVNASIKAPKSIKAMLRRFPVIVDAWRRLR